ncbi:MAG: Hpt domain-containing protein [Pseudomonadota bacterium]
MDINQLKALFIEEATEVIEKLNIDIINFEQNPQNTALLDELYRGVHTLKGSANAFEFSRLGEFVHHFEDALSYFREIDSHNDKTITAAEIDVFLEAVDIIKVVLQLEIEGTEQLPQNYASCLEHIKIMIQKDDTSDSSACIKSDFVTPDLGVEFDNEDKNSAVLEVNLDINIDDISKLKSDIIDRLDSLEKIVTVGGVNDLSSSCLLQLLFSIKKTKPSLHIPLIDEPSFLHINYGKIVWQKSRG